MPTVLLLPFPTPRLPLLLLLPINRITTIHKSKELLGQIFSPIFSPSPTGNPACTTLLSPFPFGSRLTQNTAFPLIGLNFTPFDFPSISPRATLSLYSPSRLDTAAGEGSTNGKNVSPLVQLSCEKTKNDATRLNYTCVPVFSSVVIWCSGQKSVWRSYFWLGK
jgi:hypothetical protein